MADVYSFSSYQKRAQRMKKLEQVLDKSKEVCAAFRPGNSQAVVKAIKELKELIEQADKLPPPHISER